jgi:ABC-type nickel/cobalt efflux system permease component RcnA/ABC-type uncharacterized transport system substrate-binding protein
MRTLLLFFLFIHSALACATCSLSIPTTTVSYNLHINDQNKLTELEVTWTFERYFSRDLLQLYDKSQNGDLEKNEQADIAQNLQDYIEQYDYLLNVAYSSTPNSEATTLPITFKSSNHHYKNEQFVYTYTVTFDQPLHKGGNISIIIDDENSNFIFTIDQAVVHSKWFQGLANINSNILFISLYHVTDQLLEQPQPMQIEKTEPTIQEESFELSWVEELAKKLFWLIENIKEQLQNLNQNWSWFAALSLFTFSFGYGMLHAAGPGHGKTLVASYFFASKQSYSKAVSMSFVIAVVHTFSALILALVIYFFLKVIVSQFVNDTAGLINAISGGVIILIASYLLWRKYSTAKKYHLDHDDEHNHHHHHVNCNCATTTNSTDLGVVLSAGIVPCPGTVTIFLFTFSLESYGIGFALAMVMSLGMSLVILLSAISTTWLRTKVDHLPHKLIDAFEYGAFIFILLLGLLLLMA